MGRNDTKTCRLVSWGKWGKRVVTGKGKAKVTHRAPTSGEAREG